MFFIFHHFLDTLFRQSVVELSVFKFFCSTRGLATCSPYYNIVLKQIKVAGTPLPVAESVFDARFGTVLDSGTTYAYLPETAFVEFKKAVMILYLSP